MMTLDVGNLHLWRLLGAEPKLAYSVHRNSYCGFVADAAVTCGNKCSDIDHIQRFPNSKNVVIILKLAK